jgi:DNA-binding transcriptional LysR family regulator
VSRQIAVLERQLGIQLLRRARGGVEPTEAGRVLLHHTDAALDRLALAEAQVGALVGALAGTATGIVRLGSFFTALVHLSAEIGAQLGDRHPYLVIADDLVDRPTAMAKLGRGELDLALVFTPDFEPGPTPAGLHLAPLFSDPVRILLPAGHPLAARPVIDIDDLRDETWLRAHDGSAARLTDHVLARHGLTPHLMLAGHGDEPVEVQALVAAGRGVALTHDLTVVVSRHQLAVLPIAGATTTRQVSLAVAEGPLTAAAAIAYDAILEVGRRHRQRLSGN